MSRPPGPVCGTSSASVPGLRAGGSEECAPSSQQGGRDSGEVHFPVALCSPQGHSPPGERPGRAPRPGRPRLVGRSPG